MKLIIDIDEDSYKEIKKIVADGNDMFFTDKLIANGTPFDSNSDEDKVIHNATFYICEAVKDGRIGRSEDITRKLYNYAYARGFEAGKKEGTIKVKEKIVYHNANEKFEFNGEI